VFLIPEVTIYLSFTQVYFCAISRGYFDQTFSCWARVPQPPVRRAFHVFSGRFSYLPFSVFFSLIRFFFFGESPKAQIYSQFTAGLRRDPPYGSLDFRSCRVWWQVLSHGWRTRFPSVLGEFLSGPPPPPPPIFIFLFLIFFWGFLPQQSTSINSPPPIPSRSFFSQPPTRSPLF